MNRRLFEQMNAQITPSRQLLEDTRQKVMAGPPAPSKPRLSRYAAAAACLLLLLGAALLLPRLPAFLPAAPGEEASSLPTVPSQLASSFSPESSAPAENIPYESLRFPPSEGSPAPSADLGLSMDIAAFDESMLQNAAALLEGMVVNSYYRDYAYDIPSDKFEENGVLHAKTRTLVYEFQITNVLYTEEEFSTGQTIRVETLCFNGCHAGEEPPYPLRTGHTYLLPLATESSLQYIQTVSGPLDPEGQYSIVYPFAPQIERTLDGQYVFHSLWSSLWDESTANVVCEEGDYPYLLKLRSDEAFLEDLKSVLTRYR